MTWYEITESEEYGEYFIDYDNEILRMYKLVNEENCYNVAKEVAQEYLEKINTNSRRDICITFIKEFEIETEINENFEPEGSSSCILDVARILEVEDINYTDFDIIFYNIKDKKIINLLEEKYMINNYKGIII